MADKTHIGFQIEGVLESRPWLGYLLSAGLVGLATLIGLPFRETINPTNLIVPYLVAVILAAAALGRGPAVSAAVLATAAFDIVFVPHGETFAVDDVEYLLTFAGLLSVALVVSTLTSCTRQQERAARRREQSATALYELSQKLAIQTDLDDIARAAVEHVKQVGGWDAALFLPADRENRLHCQAATGGFLREKDTLGAAEWVFRHGQTAGRETGRLRDFAAQFLPLRTASRTVGVLAIDLPPTADSLSTATQRPLGTIASQVAIALERAILAEEARRTHLLAETEKLQTALLNSISHDLRTPLATITGTLSSLHDDADLLTPEDRQELIDAAWEEARRLNRLVGNLLDMTRLESGALKMVRRPADLADLAGAALTQIPERLEGRPLTLDIPPHLPPVDVDFSLMVQVLVNLLDNALKYSPAGSPLTLAAALKEEGVQLAVLDRGQGLRQEDLPHLFEKFYRGRPDGSGAGGTGLGLSIARGIVEAHGGRIEAGNRPDGGAAFTIILPLSPPAVPGQSAESR